MSILNNRHSTMAVGKETETETDTVAKAERQQRARLRILELANMISVPMSLNAIVHLKIPDAIWQGGCNVPLSASEILTRVLPSSGGDADNLDRILRMLTSYGVFVEDHSPAAAAERSRRYCLSEVGETLVTDSDGLSYGPYVLQHHQDALMRAWPKVHEAVIDGTTEPFVKANGEDAYSYYGKKTEMNELMKKAMSGVSVPFMKEILDGYDGFEGIEKLVDVGGSAGDCLRMILHKHPHIKEGINFDLPQVLAEAPNIPRVRHVGGDMFKTIPTGDAIFMKWVLSTWTDDECKIILENCCKSLPAGGKLIACEPTLPEKTDDSHRTRALLANDIFIMTIYKARSKQRTEEQFRQLGVAAGFSTLQAFHIDYFYCLLEFHK